MVVQSHVYPTLNKKEVNCKGPLKKHNSNKHTRTRYHNHR
jgi:hypothetical protein